MGRLCGVRAGAAVCHTQLLLGRGLRLSLR
jgi:hypothetical protein